LQSVFLEMFGDPVRNEMGWEVKKLGKICEINPRIALDSNLSDDLEVTFLPMKCVQEMTGKLDLSLFEKVSHVKTGYTPFKNGDLLFAKITPCMENGKIAIAHNLKNNFGFASTEFHVLRFPNSANTIYYRQVLFHKTIRDFAARNMTGTAGQQRVPTTFLQNLSVPLPPLALQQQFARVVKSVERIRDQQLASGKEIEGLCEGLMQRAFVGDLSTAKDSV
jgi:type I restriction enzyme, S subunit